MAVTKSVKQEILIVRSEARDFSRVRFTIEHKYVSEYIAGYKSIPLQASDEYIAGSEEEAKNYSCLSAFAWKSVPGAKEWLKRIYNKGIAIKGNTGGIKIQVNAVKADIFLSPAGRGWNMFAKLDRFTVDHFIKYSRKTELFIYVEDN